MKDDRPLPLASRQSVTPRERETPAVLERMLCFSGSLSPLSGNWHSL